MISKIVAHLERACTKRLCGRNRGNWPAAFSLTIGGVTPTADRQRKPDGSLQAAMALLVNNRAALVAQHALFLNEMAEMRKEHSEILKEFEVIKVVLARPESILEKLVDAVRDKIGFKQ